MGEDVVELYRRSLEEFGRRVHAVRPDQWGCPTPCDKWEVRNLVSHLVTEQLWVPPLVTEGLTVADVGDRLDGDPLGADPVAAWDAASSAALAAFAAPGALERTVHLSYGDRPAGEYAREMLFDLVVHSWDLAAASRATRRSTPSWSRPSTPGSTRRPTCPTRGCTTRPSRSRPTPTSRPA